MAQPAFAVGQKWSTKDKPTIIVIGRVDRLPGGTIVHVSAFDMPLNFRGAVHRTTVAHLPLSEEGLAGSVDQLLATDALSADEFEEGYQMWREDSGGFFTGGG